MAFRRTFGLVTEALIRHKARTACHPSRGRCALASAALLIPIALSATADVEQNSWYLAGRAALDRMHAERPTATRARNVILFVGDGMSVATVTAARILQGQLMGESGEENLLAFEKFPDVALSKTYNTNQQVPDSAGTMTALVSGIKTKAGVLGIDESAARGNHRQVSAAQVPSLFALAEARGLATGIVTTTRVTHATPGACYAHSPERNWESDAELSEAARTAGFPDMALQLIQFPDPLGEGTGVGNGLEVVLGGGRREFLPSSESAELAAPGAPTMGPGVRLGDRNLISEWIRSTDGARFVSNTQQLDAVDPSSTTRLLGLFSLSHMSFEADRNKGPKGEPSLAQMTAKAIALLSREKAGYVLMVEGGRIDHAHHVNSAYRALTDTIAFSDAVRTAVERTNPNETLIVVTADHSHTMTISGYPHRGNNILGLVRGNTETGDVADDFTRDLLGKPYTTLGYANGPGYTGKSDVQPAGPKHYPHQERRAEGITSGRPDLSEALATDPNYLQESIAPLGYETHGGDDVAIYAKGPSAWLFNGVVEQNYVFHAITEALGWNAEPDGPGSAEDDEADR